MIGTDLSYLYVLWKQDAIPIYLIIRGHLNCSLKVVCWTGKAPRTHEHSSPLAVYDSPGLLDNPVLFGNAPSEWTGGIPLVLAVQIWE